VDSYATPESMDNSTFRNSIILSVLMIVAGILAIIMPGAAGIAVNVMVGWLLLFGGGLHFVFAWTSRRSGGLILGIILGLLYGFVGMYLLLNPITGLISLTLALAVYLFAEGVLEFFLAFQLRGTGRSGWLVPDGILTIILAVMIVMTWPANTEWVIGTLVGISILFTGVTRLAMTLAARRRTPQIRVA
jgi:uncharacterized membrane protein HdeD (DUF308 family)